MKKEEPKIERDSTLVLADELDRLQKEKNNGRGVSCVRTVITYLRRGDIESAKAAAWTDADKIVSYPDIRMALQRELYSEDDDEDMPPHFREVSDYLYNK